MDRNEAELAVSEVEIKVNQFRAVTDQSARDLLGEKYEWMTGDPIRRLGPTDDTFYPWNVVDYMCTDKPLHKRG